MVQAIDLIAKKLEEIKIAKDNFLGNDLSFERKFLDDVTEMLRKELKDCEVSTYLGKKLMEVCCETLVLTKISGKKILKVINRMLDGHFFKGNGLLELGWCSRYMMNKRNINYPKGSKTEKTSIAEFYWFNSSQNRYKNQQVLTEVCICRCINCTFFKVDSRKRVLEILKLVYLVSSLHTFIYIGIIIVIDKKGD